MAAAQNEQRRQRTDSWRQILVAVIWCVITGVVVAIAGLLAEAFSASLGLALGADEHVETRVSLFWGFAACTAIIAVAAVLALIMRRWVALVLALLVAVGSAYLAAGTYLPLRAYINPPAVVQDEPIHCQCYSGGSCDCPGG